MVKILKGGAKIPIKKICKQICGCGRWRGGFHPIFYFSEYNRHKERIKKNCSEQTVIININDNYVCIK